VAKSKKRQLVLTRPTPPGEPLEPIGTLDQLEGMLARFNTAPDGAPASTSRGTRVLYGPGYIAEVPSFGDGVTQVMVSVNDEETAWPVLSRMCKALRLRMTDLDTGQSFGG
jgi:hypothetical protein